MCIQILTWKQKYYEVWSSRLFLHFLHVWFMHLQPNQYRCVNYWYFIHMKFVFKPNAIFQTHQLLHNSMAGQCFFTHSTYEWAEWFAIKSFSLRYSLRITTSCYRTLKTVLDISKMCLVYLKTIRYTVVLHLHALLIY